MKSQKIQRLSKNHFSDTGGKSGAKTISRRKVLKNLFLAPLHSALLLLTFSQKENYPAVKQDSTKFSDNNNLLSPARKEDVYAPNKPVGEAKGIYPGRVSWVWNPEATNPDCTNALTTPDKPDLKYDPWFLDKNTNQDIVDKMLIAGLCSMTGKKEPVEAWDAVFRYHNKKRGKGDVPYQKGEKIYLKLNRTSASAGLKPDFGRLDDKPISLLCETSPQITHSMIRQLVNIAGVPQENIYVGDAMREIFQDEYIKYHSEFPNVVYLSHTGNESGRIKSSEGSKEVIFYSDNSSIMTKAGADKIYSVLEDADYLISLAAMKGHNAAGISLCTKNHFGTQSRPAASHLHPGLNSKSREGYGFYRVLVDLMGNKYTGGKNLFYILDALWTGGNWNALPAKFIMSPFNKHWSSSLLVSFDPVAIESVAFDFLRTEFLKAEYNLPHINAPGVDDYLHQAADSRNWPKGIIYTPDGAGVPMAKSLGVHEHWNNPADKKYSRDLGKNKGIELIKIFQEG